MPPNLCAFSPPHFQSSPNAMTGPRWSPDIGACKAALPLHRWPARGRCGSSLAQGGSSIKRSLPDLEASKILGARGPLARIGSLLAPLSSLTSRVLMIM